VLSSAAGPRPRALVIVTEVCLDGGIQRFNRTFINACDQLGVDCHVLSLGDPEHARVRWSAPTSARIETFNRDKLRFALRVGQQIIRGTWQFIVIGHINLLELAVAARRLKSGARTFLVAHGVDAWTGIEGRRRRALRSVDVILCVSSYTRDRVRAQAPEVPTERFRIFPNALSETWSEQVNRAVLERPAGLPERYLLAVTRIDRGDRYKGLISVLETLSMLEDQTVHFVIAGRGNDIDFLKRAARHFGIAERVHLIGGVTDAELAELYRHCLAFVLPSGKEGFGIVYLEAMHFEACIVAAREKGVLDVIRDEETGLLVTFGDVVGLKRALDRLIGDAGLRQRLSAAARSTVTADGPFTIAAYTARLATALGLAEPARLPRATEAESTAVALPAGTGESCA